MGCLKPRPGDLFVGWGYTADRLWLVMNVTGDDIEMLCFGKGVMGKPWMLSYRAIQLELATGMIHHVRPE